MSREQPSSAEGSALSPGEQPAPSPADAEGSAPSSGEEPAPSPADASAPLMEEAKESGPAFGLDSRVETPNFPSESSTEEEDAEAAPSPEGWTTPTGEAPSEPESLSDEAPRNTIGPG